MILHVARGVQIVNQCEEKDGKPSHFSYNIMIWGGVAEGGLTCNYIHTCILYIPDKTSNVLLYIAFLTIL